MNVPIIFANKFNLSLEQNWFLAKKNSVKLIHSMSCLKHGTHYYQHFMKAMMITRLWRGLMRIVYMA